MKKHHTKEKGDLGILKAQVSLFEQGFNIFTSLSEHLPFDLVAYKNGKFYRIQVKYRAMKDGAIMVGKRTSYADRNGSHNNYYDEKDIDIFCVYCPNNDKCYFIPNVEFNKFLSLRILEPKKKQGSNVKYAVDYEFIK